MFNKFRVGAKVFIYGTGETDGQFYDDKPAIILERDRYYKDYHVQFQDGSKDWILEEYIRKPYERRKGDNRV